MDFFRFTGVLLILINLSSRAVNSQMKECSLQGIDLQRCLDQDDESMLSSYSCCRVLNLAVQAGYHCLCSLLKSSTPLLSLTLSLELANCYVSLPSFSQCHLATSARSVPTLNSPPARPIPVQMPRIPMEQSQPSSPGDVLVHLPPKVKQIALNSSFHENSTMGEVPPSISSDDLPKQSISELGDMISYGVSNTITLLHLGLFYLLHYILSCNELAKFAY